MRFKSLYQYLWEQADKNDISDSLLKVILDVALGGKILRSHIVRNAYSFAQNVVETENTHGEKQHRLDLLAHEIFLNALKEGNVCRYMISEESADRIEFTENSHKGQFSVYIDPLDGTSNVDSNVTVGTIFSIYSSQGEISQRKNIETGRAQLASGYIIYGTSTMLVLTMGSGVHGFSYDTQLGEFILSHPNMKVPKSGSTYAINEGNFENFPSQIREYLSFCKQSDAENNLPYKCRYIGSMVADMHRILLHGGIFMYPSTRDYPNGKLRLMYECMPMALILEQAGGLAIDGMRPILDIEGHSCHQKIPFIAGSYNMVRKVLSLYKNESIKNHLLYCC